MSDASELAQKKAELEKLCDEYTQHTAKIHETFAAIVREIKALPEEFRTGGVSALPRDDAAHQSHPPRISRGYEHRRGREAGELRY
jgi:hypothetical protein